MARIRNTNAQRARWNSNASGASIRRAEQAARDRIERFTRDGRPALVWTSETSSR